MGNGKAYLIAFAGFGEGLTAVGAAQTRGDGFLDNRLTRRDGVQRRIERPALDGKFPVLGDDFLPRDAVDALKQRLEIGRGERPDFEQYPRPATQIQIQPRDIADSPRARHPPVLGLDVLAVQPPQFVRHDAFQPQQTRNR